MLYKEYIKISSLSVHRVGNKAAVEGVELSERPVEIDDALAEILKGYFLMAFKDDEKYHFYHLTDLGLNAVYSYVKSIFTDISCFHEQSRNIAKFLYEQSEHPNIKSGDFYVIYLKDCILDGETVDAVGLFKSENKDTFIQINPVSGGFSVESHTGMSIHKLDKGCLVFNTRESEGYTVCVVDNSNRSDAKYWVNDFLQLKRVEDDYKQTEQAVTLCKNFIKQLPENFDKAAKATMMNKVMETLGGENVSLGSIASSAFEQTGTAEAFMTYADEYQVKQEMTFKDSFQGKSEVLGRRKVSAVTRIKLDDNFEINVLGGEKYLESGYDEERGMRYYTLYFKEER